MKPKASERILESEMEPCDQVRAALTDRSLPTRTDLAAHLEGCEVCRALVAATPALERGQEPPASERLTELDAAAAFGALNAALARETGLVARLRSLDTLTRRAALLGVLGALVGALYWAGFTSGALGAAPPMKALGGALLAGALLVLAAHALHPLHRPSASPARARALYLVAGALLLVAGLSISRVWSDPAASLGVNLGLVCLGFGLGVAAVTYGLFRLLDRSPASVSALPAAVMAALAGNVFLHLRCPNESASHFLFGHFGVLVSLLGAAWWWRTRFPPLSSNDARR